MNIAIIIKGKLQKLLVTEDPWTYVVGFDHEVGTPFHHYYHPDTHTFVTVRDMGDDIYEGSASEEAIEELTKLGMMIAKLHEVSDGDTALVSKAELMASGMVETDGYLVPSHKIAGDNAESLGRKPDETGQLLTSR